MNRYGISLVVFGLLVVVLGVSLWKAPGRQVVQSAMIGKPAPAFELPDLLDPAVTVKSTAYRGRWHLVNVWGPWCVSCRVEHPVFMDIQREGKVALVGLYYPEKTDQKSDEQEDEEARQWLADLGNPYEQVPTDREGRAILDYGVYGAPESFLVNPQGVIVHKVVGVVTPEMWREMMAKHVEGAAP